jgi:hypothetical protein
MTMSERDDIAACAEHIAALAAHLERLDSGSGDATALRMCAAYLVQQQREIEALRSAMTKAHEAAEISECRIAEVYGRIVTARDLVRAWLEPGLDDFRDVFDLLQEAKYGLGGRTNVAGSIAVLQKGIK